MRKCLTVLMLFVSAAAFAQLEVSTGFAINKNNAAGFPVHLSYEFPIKGRWYTKSQVGYKHLSYYNEYVGANLYINSWEIHQTLSYEVVKKRKYVFKPNIGLNYRFYYWKGKMQPPYNTLPQRAWVIGVREGNFILNSYDNGYHNEYRVNNLGFSFQFQNQFRLNNRVWLHITPFVEPDYDRGQNTGGCYLGIILKEL